ncbi:MAG TPA: hypothetical protein VND45_16255 [Thermoanaerobaculia bacterium]|jgi:hypothetical protein|nr:hypothetical protein [Thermoanaerobaculia bacterium]
MTHDHDHKMPIAIPLAELKQEAAAIAAAMQDGVMNAALRERFINVRAALFQRGIYDPVLVRFDSYTAPKATAQEIAEQLATVGTNL